MSSTGSDGGPRTKVPLAGVTGGRLLVEGGLDHTTITTDHGLGDLLHGSWKREPKVEAEDGLVTLTYPRFRLARRARPGTDEITLNPTVPWDISIHGSVQRVGADLRGLKLRSFSITGGATRLVLLLGKPDQNVHLELRSADKVTIRRPENTQVRVRIAKGATQVTVDDQFYRAIGGETILTTGPIVWNDYHLALTGARRLRLTTL